MHDVCINIDCDEPNDNGDVGVCLGRRALLASCRLNPLLFGCVEALPCCAEKVPQCSPDCLACHDAVMGCWAGCLRAVLPVCPGPSTCCDIDPDAADCDEPQQCFDNASGTIIYDSCVCTRLDKKPVDPCNGEPGGNGDSWGDVHLVTFDQLAYDFQAVGEFVLVRSLDDGLEIQSRTKPWGSSQLVSVNSAVAMRVAGDRVGFSVDHDPGLYVNGVAAALEQGATPLPAGGVVEAADGLYIITWPDGSSVRIRPLGDYFDLEVSVPGTRRGRVVGLLGNFDGIPENDLVTRNGKALDAAPTGEELYDLYGESWRITQGESLFDYVGGETTETFTDRTFPLAVVTADSVPAVSRQRAEQMCRASGVTDPILLDACIIDVALTGDESFAVAPARIPPPAGTVTIGGAAIYLYRNDFEGSVGPEWSHTTTSTTPSGARRFLGEFGNDTVSLNFTGLPAHNQVSLSFELFLIRSWDGNASRNAAGTVVGPDAWELTVAGGTTLLRTTFGNHDFIPILNRQAYPHAYPDGEHPARTGASENNTLGYAFDFVEEGLGSRPLDSVYRLTFTFDHTATSLGFDFTAFGLQSLSDESWGLDNVTVSVIGPRVLERTEKRGRGAAAGTSDILAFCPFTR